MLSGEEGEDDKKRVEGGAGAPEMSRDPRARCVGGPDQGGKLGGHFLTPRLLAFSSTSISITG